MVYAAASPPIVRYIYIYYTYGGLAKSGPSWDNKKDQEPTEIIIGTQKGTNHFGPSIHGYLALTLHKLDTPYNTI